MSKKKLTLKDLVAIREAASAYLSSFPSKTRLTGMVRVLTESEVLMLAYVEATLQLLHDETIDIALETPDCDPIE